MFGRFSATIAVTSGDSDEEYQAPHHHALQSNTIVTEKPIFVDIRPWVHVCDYRALVFDVQEIFAENRRMLLSAILSDTLNLKSPTHYGVDRESLQC